MYCFVWEARLGLGWTDLDGDEIGPALVGQSLGEKGLAASRGAEKQHTWVGRVSKRVCW